LLPSLGSFSFHLIVESSGFLPGAEGIPTNTASVEAKVSRTLDENSLSYSYLKETSLELLVTPESLSFSQSKSSNGKQSIPSITGNF
jgi:hypothetical protein